MNTQPFVGALDIVECCDCHVIFGMMTDMHRKRLNDSATFYCPAGHQQYYSDKNHADKLREAVIKLNQARCEQERLQGVVRDRDATIKAARMNFAKAKHKCERLVTRIKAGVCSCCNRTFQNLARHMEIQHSKSEI